MAAIDFEFLFQPLEELDAWLTGLLDGAPLLVALGIAFVLGLRHASDPDHLVAVTALVAADDGDARSAARLGAWWGLGHASALVALGRAADRLQVAAPGLARVGGREGDRDRHRCARGAGPVEMVSRRLSRRSPFAPRRARQRSLRCAETACAPA